MSDEVRQVRGMVPLDVSQRITAAAEALGQPVGTLAGAAMMAGLDQVIRERIADQERRLALLRDQLAPVTNGADPAPVTDAPAPPRRGRAEKAAAVRAEELAETRRRGRRAKNGE